MEAKEVLKKVAVLLGFKEGVKLEQMKLDDGQTTIEADVFEVGAMVNIVADDQTIPLPIGEYILEDGRVLMVEQEGIIAEIKTQVEEPEVEEPAQVEEVEAEVEKPSPTKKIVESTVKETYFERNEELLKENEELKTKISYLETKLSAIKVVEEKEEVVLENVKPIQHNPENVAEVIEFKYAQKRPMSAMDRVLKQINK